MNTKVNIAGVELKNPITVASGTFGSGMEYSEFVDLSKLGAVVTKGVANVTFGRQEITGENPWRSEDPKKHALVCEHEALFGSLRRGERFNTMKMHADSCYAAIAGREAAYAGVRIKTAFFKEKSKLSLVPDNLDLNGKKALEPIPSPTNYKLI